MGVVPFEDAVVARDAGAVEAGPGDALLLDVDGGIDAQLPLQLGEVGRHLQQVVVERRPARRWRRTSRRGRTGIRVAVADQHGAGDGGVVQDAVGVVGQQAVPQVGVPLVVAQVDAQEQAGRHRPASAGVMRGCQDRLLSSLARALR